jgi:hypothetical protein
MISLAGMMTNFSSRVMPLALPSPTTISRNARSFMSMARCQEIFFALIASSFPQWMWLSTMAERSACALAMAWKSPVKWRLMSSIGSSCE